MVAMVFLLLMALKVLALKPEAIYNVLNTRIIF